MMYVGEVLVVVFGVLIRLLLSKTADNQIMKNIGFSVTESWDSVEEAIALKDYGISAYEGDVVHLPPLAIFFWKTLRNVAASYTTVLFLLLDVAMALFLMRASTRMYRRMQKVDAHRPKGDVCPESREKLILKPEGWRSVRMLVLAWYLMNPYTLVSFVLQSTVIMSNFVIVSLMLAVTEGNYRLAAILAAVATYLNYFPVGFLFVILSQHYKDGRRTLDSLIAFSATLIGLLVASYLIEGGSWEFLDSVYLFLVSVPDYTPHMSLYWYLFAEMFEHFREFFICVFVAISTFLPLPLSIRLRQHPTFLCLVVWLTICIFRFYPAPGELGAIISCVPLWRHFFPRMRPTLLVMVTALVVLALGPLMSYLWLYAGSANANFYFAISMLHSMTQIYLLSHLLSAFFKNEFLLRHGVKPTLPDGSALKMRLE